MTEKSSYPRFLLYLTTFLDRFGLLVVLPIFSSYLLFPEFGVFTDGAPFQEKLIILGFLLASYPFAEFIGGPIIEQYALKIGIKNALTLSGALKIAGAFIAAWAITQNDLALLFIGRILNGFPGTSRHLVKKVLEKRELSQKKVALHTAFFGLGFIGAIFLGGYFSDPTISPNYSPGYPLWILGWIYVVQLAIYLVAFPAKKPMEPKLQMRWLQCTKNIEKAFHSKQIRAICLIYFFIIFAWMTTLQFNSVYLIEKFQASQQLITSVYLVMAVFWAISTWSFDKFWAKSSCPKSTLALNLGLMTFSSGLALFAPNIISYYVAVALMAIFVSFAWCAALATKFIRVEVQLSQNKSSSLSMTSLALSIGPILLGYILYKDMGLLHLCGAVAALVGLWIHQKYYKCFQN